LRWPRASSPWDDLTPIRAELFGTERLEHHAESLAAAQKVSLTAPRVPSLSRRLHDNVRLLLEAYRFSADEALRGRPVTPAAEWLLDNFHLVELQLRQITQDLPPGFYRQLPKLEAGHLAGYPRVFGLAWAYVAHTDSLISEPVLRRFVQAYQRVTPLMIGELWAVAITLRIVLVENMRRLAAQIVEAQRLRAAADDLVDRVTGSDTAQVPLHVAVAPHDDQDLPEIFAAQIARRLRGVDPAESPLHTWLEQKLRRQGTAIEDVVARALQRQGASNVTMRNIVTSMRILSELDWADFFESVSLVDARLRASSDFAAMDFATRNSYRTAIEDLARRAAPAVRGDELAVTDAALLLVADGRSARERDPGHVLIGAGRPALERAVGYVPDAPRRIMRWLGRGGLAGFVGAIAVVTAGLLALALSAAGLAGWAALGLGVLVLPVAFALATAAVNDIVTRSVAPHPLPGMRLPAGVPPDLRTLVAVPVLLSREEEVLDQIEQLEVHHLASIGGAIHFALLSDGPDAAAETTEADQRLVEAAQAAVAAMNRRYPMAGGHRFLFLHRRRLWNPSEGRWMGWERKRGKLHELNRLLRGATDTTFVTGLEGVPQDVRLVITLDADTRLTHDTARALIGKMAHPLNRARFDAAAQRVTDGYGILQPRVTPALPIGAEGSAYQRIHSSPGGIEPYAAAISDVYQDLFGEGSFTGKGIYDVDAFSAALEGRVPDNTMLSHDLFEGIFARAALASDVEVIEDYPARYDVAAKRAHRWTRGDWQLLPWLTGARRRDRGGIPALGRWKMADNLMRSLVAPSALAALLAGWLMPVQVAAVWTLAVLTLLVLPRLIALPHAVIPRRRDLSLRAHFAAFGRDAATALAQAALGIVFLADQAWLMADAILRTLVRLAVTRRRLLEWVTAAQAAAAGRPGLAGQYRLMAPGVGLGVATVAVAVAANPPVWALALPFGAAWVLAPAVAHLVSRPARPGRAAAPVPADALRLRAIARRTWRYFETFVTEADNFLPPDNFQDNPAPAVAHRTSPTNIGLYLLSTVAARDLGWIAEPELIGRLERTLATMDRMARLRGHFFNWYDTRTLAVLDPAYVSSVDSGNLAGHLLAVAQACREWAAAAPSDPARADGLRDALHLARASFPAEGAEAGLAALDRLEAALASGDPAALGPPAAEAHRLAREGGVPEALHWTDAILRRLESPIPAPDRSERLAAIAARAERFATGMDFAFLLDPDKELLSIGFSAASNARDASCYDLLASEARLASLFAIAKHDLRPRHWFRLGRGVTPVGARPALISWSGSMFEYLMPSLVMRAPEGSLLADTARGVVARQQAYGRSLGIPWGVSESAYNARDLQMVYQYSNFGVPGLGLKRGLAQNRVIAPYATGLAAMVDPAAAVANFARLAELGAEGRHGFYEAIDFTPDRLPEGQTRVIVQSFMAHHQGMTITAIANAVLDGILRRRFHAVPMIKAVDLLLQERVPRDVAISRPHAEEVKVTASQGADGARVRWFDDPATAAPTAHLLSNGRYGVMLTPTGAGYSRWRDIAVSRWRADATVDGLGSFLYLRDTVSGERWSGALLPLQAPADRQSAVFAEHQATFSLRHRTLATTTEVVVSSEDDAEARRVTLTNTGRSAREIEVTSYIELALAPQAADLAHPAFSKMFVVTDFLPELGVLIATRRRRSPGEAEVWAAHIAVVEGEETAPLQFETDRARFIGRGQSLRRPAVIAATLSGSTGTVLDPIFALRRRVRVPPGGQARVTFWTMIADRADTLLDLVDRHRDPSAFDRAATLAWTHAQVQLRHMGISAAQAADFQTLGGMVLRADARLRPPAARIIAGAGPQSGLWPFGISGDLPIVLLLIEDAGDLGRVSELLDAQEYWRARQLAVDVVILNERSASYVQDLQIGIEAAVRAAQARPRSAQEMAGRQGGVHVLRADLITPEARALFLSVARAVLVASRGEIGQEIEARGWSPAPDLTPLPLPSQPDPAPPQPALEFFNGTGGFAAGGREYVVVLKGGQTTPAPWVNVVANAGFGFIASAEGSGPVWAENSRENLLTPWSNDPVCDPPGEAVYLRDLDSGVIWTPTALPMRSRGTYVARHGFGYVRYEHAANGIAASMLRFVPLDDPVRITRLTLRNTSGRVRRVMVTAYAEWVLGAARSTTAATIVTELDAETGAVMARNPWGTAFPGRVAFADIGRQVSGFTCDRAEVLGPGGSLADPRGLRGQTLSGRRGAALDPCAAQQRVVTLQPGQTAELRMLLGQARSPEAARSLIARWRDADLDAALAAVAAQWDDLLGTVQVKTPDRAMDILLNGWLLYQTLACRIWARAGFYQASGAYGFRDQLQDGMALTFARPELTREHLLRAVARQFPEGDVQHWWLPHSGQGVRTRISDDRVWLGYGVARYVAVTGDEGLLDEEVPFLRGPPVPPGAHDAFFQPEISDETASVFEHCARGLDQCIELTGTNGIPLIGTGDWNDGMNHVGAGGAGTSVWLGWLFIATVGLIAPLADRRDPARAARWRRHAESVRQAIEDTAWDGAWYRRGTFDDGTPLGAASSEECRIDSIAQSWAVLSGAARPDRAAQAMRSVEQHLIRPDARLALLFTPPFDRTPLDPGYIKGYPPGLRENGGQYSHAAMWAILAQVRLGQGDRAAALFRLLNPINHALTAQDAQRYKAEPYVIAGDVYAAPDHVGRAGWSWYTGSAGWMYRAGIEGIIGLTRAGETLSLHPCLPPDWPEVQLSVRRASSHLDIRVLQDGTLAPGTFRAELDGRAIDGTLPMTIRLVGRAAELTVAVGPAEAEDRSVRPRAALALP
jgi:cyclic beta-1,2-glucan synthetase